MASLSIPKFIANPTIVKVIKFPRLVFQLVPEIAKNNDNVGEFSQIPKGFVFVEDPRMYIHCHIEELGDEEIKSMYKIIICDDSDNVKLEHKIVETLGFTKILSILDFSKEFIKIILSRVHGAFFQLESVHKITKEVVKVVTGLPSIGNRPDKTKKVSNDLVMNPTSATSDKRSLRLNDVTDINVKFISMILCYKTTHTNRLNLVSSLCIKSTYDMVKNNAKIDVCESLKDELIDNVGKIKKDKKGTFKFDNLLVYLMLHITKQVPDIGSKNLSFDISVGKQLSDLLNNMGENREKNIN